jgi:hypothetical protein
MKVWADLEQSRWYNLHTDDSKYDVAYGERYGYTVIDVPADILTRWQRALTEAQDVLAEITAVLNNAATANEAAGEPC